MAKLYESKATYKLRYSYVGSIGCLAIYVGINQGTGWMRWSQKLPQGKVSATSEVIFFNVNISYTLDIEQNQKIELKNDH